MSAITSEDVLDDIWDILSCIYLIAIKYRQLHVPQLQSRATCDTIILPAEIKWCIHAVQQKGRMKLRITLYQTAWKLKSTYVVPMTTFWYFPYIYYYNSCALELVVYKLHNPNIPTSTTCTRSRTIEFKIKMFVTSVGTTQEENTKYHFSYRHQLPCVSPRKADPVSSPSNFSAHKCHTSSS